MFVYYILAIEYLFLENLADEVEELYLIVICIYLINTVKLKNHVWPFVFF